MNNLENNDFVVLNSVIYKVYTNSNFTEMRKEFLEQIKMVIDFDSAEFSLSKGNGSPILVEGVSYNCKANWSKPYEDLDYSQGILSGGKCMVYRESDIIQEKKRMESPYYQKVYEPNRWHYAMQIILAYNEEFVGVITLYRVKGKKDFGYRDTLVMDLLKDHMAYRVYKEKEKYNKVDEKITISDAVELYKLTEREHSTLNYMMQGLNNEQMCEQLFISNNTLKKHILNIYRKVGVHSRVQLFKLIKESE